MSERDKAEYRQMVERRTPRSHFVRDTWRAFWVGGLICALSEGYTLWLMRGFNFARQDAATLTSVTLVFITAALTAIGASCWTKSPASTTCPARARPRLRRRRRSDLTIHVRPIRRRLGFISPGGGLLQINCIYE